MSLKPSSAQMPEGDTSTTCQKGRAHLLACLKAWYLQHTPLNVLHECRMPPRKCLQGSPTIPQPAWAADSVQRVRTTRSHWILRATSHTHTSGARAMGIL